MRDVVGYFFFLLAMLFMIGIADYLMTIDGQKPDPFTIADLPQPTSVQP